jgi:hypothetical protein
VKTSWIAFVDEPRNAVLRARVEEGGWLAVWDDASTKPASAWKVDPRVIDAEGSEVVVAVAAAPAGVAIPFDDPAVTGAVRSALSSEPAELVTTLMTADGDYAGVLISPPYLATPFATIFPQKVLHVGQGVLGRTPWPTGPVTQRYTSDVPWPYDRLPA